MTPAFWIDSNRSCHNWHVAPVSTYWRPINLLILDLQRQDGVEKGKINPDTFEQYLNDSCRISFNWDSKLTWRDLTGPEKVRLLNLIDIPDLFPSQNEQLWLTFVHWIIWKWDDGNADEIEVGTKQ